MRPYRTICIAIYEDDLAGLDAFVASHGGDRSKVIRRALFASGVIATEPIIRKPKPVKPPRPAPPRQVAASFVIGATGRGKAAKNRTRTKETRRVIVPWLTSLEARGRM